MYINKQKTQNSLKPKSEFRIRAKSLFLTYCVDLQASNTYEITKEKMCSILRQKFNAQHYILVARENYKDREDAFHFHCIVCFKEVNVFRGPDFADIEFRKTHRNSGKPVTDTYSIHGNYMATKNLDRAITYCRKEGDFIENGQEVAENNKPAAKKQKINDEVAEFLAGGGSIKEVQRNYPGYFLQNQTKVCAFKNFCINNEEPDLISWQKFVEASSSVNLGESEMQVVTWLLENINQKRPLRKKQLWIKGPIGCGKTSFFMALSRFLRVYTPIYESDFLQDYSDTAFDLILFDEYKGQKTLTFLNSFIDGSDKKYNVKFTHITKKKNLPVIFLSNFAPSEVYSRANDVTLDAFRDRLDVVEVTDLYGVCDLLTVASANPAETAPIEVAVDHTDNINDFCEPLDQ